MSKELPMKFRTWLDIAGTASLAMSLIIMLSTFGRIMLHGKAVYVEPNNLILTTETLLTLTGFYTLKLKIDELLN